eukprot:TRINITY_DN25475_c0_g1_i1.p1 TRINITY_DN25475_c0_g1~~TRINITY_DN25475_c0_g1_i1.p1  ORF type:complete len:1060 (+),score=263.50 TRINITY_DN25475_c0_g1_i1:350-3529(+)
MQALLQISEFDWIANKGKDDGSPDSARKNKSGGESPRLLVKQLATAASIVEQHGVPDEVLLDSVQKQMQKDEAFRSMPFTILLTGSFSAMVILHDAIIPAISVEETLIEHILGNAEFAPTSEDVYHKIHEDVHSAGDFWDWLSGYIGVMFEHDAESPREDRGSLLKYNNILGGIRLRQERADATECESLADILRYYRKSCVGGNSYEMEPEVPSAFSTVKPHRELWLYVHDDPEVVQELAANTSDSWEGGWIDRETRKVEVALAVYNPQVAMHALITTNFYFSKTGHIWKKNIAMATPAKWFSGWESYAPDIIWLTCLMASIGLKLKELAKFASAAGRPKFGFFMLIDYIAIFFGGVLIVLFMQRYVQAGRINVLARRMQGFYKEEDDSSYTLGVTDYFRTLEYELHALFLFRCLAGGYPLLIMMSLFKAFSAQAKLSIVTNTLGVSFVDMLHFGLVFISIFCSFSLAGMTIFGLAVPEFSTFGRAVVNVFFILMGAFEYEELETVGRFEALTWFFSVQLVMSMIMLNMFLAIVMEAYSKEAMKLQKATTLPAQLMFAWTKWHATHQGLAVALPKVQEKVREKCEHFETTQVANKGSNHLSMALMDGFQFGSGSLHMWASMRGRKKLYRIVRVQTLLQVCPEMRQAQARQLLASSVEHYYSKHHVNHDQQETGLELIKLNTVTKIMKTAILEQVFKDRLLRKMMPTQAEMNSLHDDFHYGCLKVRRARQWTWSLHEQDVKHQTSDDEPLVDVDRAAEIAAEWIDHDDEAEVEFGEVKSADERQQASEKLLKAKEEQLLRARQNSQHTVEEAVQAVIELQAHLEHEKDRRTEVAGQYKKLDQGLSDLNKVHKDLEKDTTVLLGEVEDVKAQRDEYKKLAEAMEAERDRLKEFAETARHFPPCERLRMLAESKAPYSNAAYDVLAKSTFVPLAEKTSSTQPSTAKSESQRLGRLPSPLVGAGESADRRQLSPRVMNSAWQRPVAPPSDAGSHVSSQLPSYTGSQHSGSHAGPLNGAPRPGSPAGVEPVGFRAYRTGLTPVGTGARPSGRLPPLRLQELPTR